MTKAARWTEFAVGLFFLVSAAAKAIDMNAFGVQISAYGVVKTAEVVRVSAWVALVVETLLGGALVAGVRLGGLTHAAAGAMILVYSTLIAYAWAFHGLTDCGCLGAWLPMSPPQSLLKNIVLLAALGFAWIGGWKPAVVSPAAKRGRYAAASAGLLAVVALSVYGASTTGPSAPANSAPADGTRPFAQFVFDADGQRFDLGKGQYLVAFLNATCEHCRKSVPAINRLVETPGLPPVVALMMGNADDLADFQKQTQPLFATHLIESLTFMEFIGSVPPRLSYIKDGVGVQSWDWTDDVPEAGIVTRFKPKQE